MTDEVKNCLWKWEQEIEDEVEKAYTGITTCSVSIRVVEEFNYLLRLEIDCTCYYTTMGNDVVCVNQLDDSHDLLIDQHVLLSNAYNALPVRDIIEQLYRRCNGYDVYRGNMGNPWGSRKGFQ